MSSEKISEDIESIKDNLFKISTKIDNQNLAIQILKGESNNNNSIVSNHLSYLENNKVSKPNLSFITEYTVIDTNSKEKSYKENQIIIPRKLSLIRRILIRLIFGFRCTIVNKNMLD